jgi:two-component system nitrate/nitrite response regulator NarL
VDLLGAIGFTPIEEVDEPGQLRSGPGEAPPQKTIIVALARGAGGAASTVAEIRSWLATAVVVCLVPLFDVEEMCACFAAGASGYILESISRDALRESLLLVEAGEKVFPSELAHHFPVLAGAPEFAERPAPLRSEAHLSSREFEILQCLANGQSNKLIAKNLGIAEATVKVHLKRILRKAHASNRTQAALWAIATGVASPPSQRGSDAGQEVAAAQRRTPAEEPRSFRPTFASPQVGEREAQPCDDI